MSPLPYFINNELAISSKDEWLKLSKVK